MRRQLAHLPLHTGAAPPWLFSRMWRSAGAITMAVVDEYEHFKTDLGIHVAGGKGGTSRKTPSEITAVADQRAINEGDRLVFASKMSAKVDSAAVQDGYQLYHHSFFLSDAGAWCVVQQGMSDTSKFARRYHWLGESVRDFVCEPHHVEKTEALKRLSTFAR